MTSARPPGDGAAPAATARAQNSAAETTRSKQEDTRLHRQPLVPRDFGLWNVTAHEGWEELARDRRHPAVYRLMFWAYARHGRNRHARFDRGELAWLIGSLDRETGKIGPMHRSNLLRLIRDAVDLGLVEKPSVARCLVLSPDRVVGGGHGNAEDRCPVHDRARKLSPDDRVSDRNGFTK